MRRGQPPERGAFDLERFVRAQEGTYANALNELRSGEKRTHWMWFTFPQLEGLGRSEMARRFAIRSLKEARAYLADPVLGPRLRTCADALLGWRGRKTAEEILGPVDAMKLRSCLTLFREASGDDLFDRALDAFFPQGPDPLTLTALRGSPA
jgi:uncharacterized protein (DUF1810 family)